MTQFHQISGSLGAHTHAHTHEPTKCTKQVKDLTLSKQTNGARLRTVGGVGVQLSLASAALCVCVKLNEC